MGLEDGEGGTMEEKKKEEEKIPHMCESGHRPLWGCCPAPTLNYNHDLRWGSWNDGLNWRKAIKCPNFI